MSDRQTPLLKKINQTLDKLENFVLSLLLFSMIGLASLQIIMRNFFQGGFVDTEPLLRLMVLWIGLIGAVAASRAYKHIAIDVITQFLSKRNTLIVLAFNHLFVASVSAIVAWHAMRFVLMDYEADSPAFGAIPSWVMELILPFAFGAIALRYGISFLENISQLLKKSSEGTQGS